MFLGEDEGNMKNKIVGIFVCTLLITTGVLTIGDSEAKTPPSEKQLSDNKGNGIRIVVEIYPIIAHPQLTAEVKRNVLQNLDGNFTAKLTYKDSELFFYSVEGGFYSSYGLSGIYSIIRFSLPVLGRLYVDFTGSGKDYGLYESINLPVIILGTKPYTWGYTPW
jgi:hypothetical protein